MRYIQLFIGKYADLFTRKGATLNSLWGSSPEGVNWDVVALGKWDLSHWQGDSITVNGKKCKK